MLPNRTAVRWRARAECIGTDPREWDLGYEIDRAWRNRDVELLVDTHVEAARMCELCPVLTECALDAAEAADESIIRAGIPIPSRACAKGHRAAHRALFAIAHGTPLDEASPAVLERLR